MPLNLAPDLVLKTGAERLLEESVRKAIAAARRLEPPGAGRRLTVRVRLSDGFAADLGTGRDLYCTVDSPA